MDTSKFLIVGANGQLGLALQAQYPTARAVDSAQLYITNRSAFDNYDWKNITHIINAAAYTNVDGAQATEGRQVAWAVNAAGIANLARIANNHAITLVHISSDYVFDGETAPHTEEEPFTPLGVYGQSKAAGDIAASLVERHYILRTTWVIGEGKNFVRTMLSLADRGISPTVVADQVGRLTFTPELVRAIDHLITTDAAPGTYNVTNDGPLMSWADITRQIFSLSGHDELTVTDTTTAAYFADKPGVAPRPLRSDMSLKKLHATGFESHDWQDELARYIEKSYTREDSRLQEDA